MYIIYVVRISYPFDVMFNSKKYESGVMEKNFGTVVNANGEVVGKVKGFWTSKFVVFIQYNDGTEGTNADDRFVNNGYSIK